METAEKAVSEVTYDEMEMAISEGVSVVDFWAPWCGPCRLLAPMFEQIGREYTGKAGFYKLNIDKEAEAAGRYGVRSIPTLLFFKDGELRDRVSGLVSRDLIMGKLEALG